MASKAQRQRLDELMEKLVRAEAGVHYPKGDVRTSTVFQIDTEDKLDKALNRDSGLTLDCSQSVELLCHIAGLKDPNDLDYKRDGYTGTLLENKGLVHYTDPKDANVGALVVFGPGTGEHVCMVKQPGEDPLLFSHGQEKGPFYIRLSEERKAHNAPVTFLSIAKL